jgi:hypothetical protein
MLSWEQIVAWLSQVDSQPDRPREVNERIIHLRSMIAVAERTLVDLHDHILRENERVLVELRAQGPFDSLTSVQQGSVYARHIGRTPLADLLHAARKGNLTLAEMRCRFKKPGDVTKFVEGMGL